MTQWAIDNGTPMETETVEARRSRLRLTWRVSESVLSGTLRPIFDFAENDIQLIIADDGSWTADDPNGTPSDYTLQPPSVEQPAFPASDTYHIDQYQDYPVDQSGTEWFVETVWVPAASREPASPQSPAQTSTEWHFQFSDGAISTNRVRYELMRDSARGYVVQLLVSPAEVEALAASASYIPVDYTTEVEGGSNVVTDPTTGDRCTVTVTPPSSVSTSAFDPDDYLVVEWDIERFGGPTYLATLELLEIVEMGGVV